MKIRAMIVDDEPLARERMVQLLGSEPDIEIVGECGDGKSAACAIKSKAPDLVFLDIQLPELDGFGMIEVIPSDRLPGIIFVTAYDQFALKALRVHAVDYLLKPVERKDLTEALEHYRDPFHRKDRSEQRVTELVRDLQRRNRIVFKCDGEVLCFKPLEIDWIESAGNYVCVHVGARTHLLRETMNEVEKKLQEHNFARIHRSTIVNLDQIKRLKPLLYGDYKVELRNGSTLTMSRKYRQAVMSRVDNL